MVKNPDASGKNHIKKIRSVVVTLQKVSLWATEKEIVMSRQTDRILFIYLVLRARDSVSQINPTFWQVLHPGYIWIYTREKERKTCL